MSYIAIVDYGAGNLMSVHNTLDYLGYENKIADRPEIIEQAAGVILPGVGAFPDAMQALQDSGLTDAVLAAAKTKPFLGICLGMQLLFDVGYEYGEHKGLGLIPGEIRPIEDVIPAGLKIPHIGWNALHFNGSCPIFKDITEGDCVYFVHSFYAADCEAFTVATAEYGAELTAAVARDNVYGCQFHPEKSGTVGLKILKAFAEL